MLSPQDLFRAGQAWISFRMGDVDQGIHIILPGDINGEPVNQEFTPFFKLAGGLKGENIGERYAAILMLWLQSQGLELVESILPERRTPLNIQPPANSNITDLKGALPRVLDQYLEGAITYGEFMRWVIANVPTQSLYPTDPLMQLVIDCAVALTQEVERLHFEEGKK